jgi:hypothetical protein
MCFVDKTLPMSKNKTKARVKAARKTARKNIELALITDLNAVAGKLTPFSKDIEKEINKDAKNGRRRSPKK